MKKRPTLGEQLKSPKALGQRIRYLRKVAKLTITELAQRIGVSKTTLSYWETARLTHRPIQARNMARLLMAFEQAGIIVSEHWLRSGAGDMPHYQDQKLAPERFYPALWFARAPKGGSTLATIRNIPADARSVDCTEEIDLFVQREPESVVIRVEHSDLQPFLLQGDWVGGVWQSSSEIPEEGVYIVKLPEGSLQVAWANWDSKSQQCLIQYLQSLKPPAVLQATHFAPVLRIWRQTPK